MIRARTRSLALCVLSACALAAWLPGTARGGEGGQTVGYEDFSELAAKVRQLESENAQIRSQFRSGTMDGYDAHGSPCGCGDGCGGGCDQCCCEPECCPCGCWYAGGELIWMKPHWSFNRAGTAFSTPTGSNGIQTNSGIVYDFEPAGRFWAGYTGRSGFGLRASWWEFDHDSQITTVTAPTPVAPFTFVQIFADSVQATGAGSSVTAVESLELQTLDFEATNLIHACGGDLTVGYGLRYAKTAVGTHARAFSPTSALLQTTVRREEFEGLGPTLALEFNYPLCFSGFSLYSNLRGSVAFGESRDSFSSVQVGTPVRTFAFSSVADDSLAIADVQFALQYSRCGWFARAGWQAQWQLWSSVDLPLGIEGFDLTAGVQF